MRLALSLYTRSSYSPYEAEIGDNWIGISSKNGDHITYMMLAPGGELIRHVEPGEDSMAIGASIRFVPSTDRSALHSGQFPFAN